MTNIPVDVLTAMLCTAILVVALVGRTGKGRHNR